MTTTPTAPLTLDAAPEQLKVVAYLVTGLSSGEPSICFEDERGDYGDEDHMPVFEALVRKSEFDALLAQLEEQRAVSARMEADARRYQFIRARNGDFAVEHHKNGWATCLGPKELDAAIDAAAKANGSEHG